MTEYRALYTVGNADSVPDPMTPEAAIVTLSGQVHQLEMAVEDYRKQVEQVRLKVREWGGNHQKIMSVQCQVDALSDRIDRLQDAHLAPTLEHSLFLVELRRIADALAERLPVSAHDNITANVTSSGDRDHNLDIELWWLARAYATAWKSRGSCLSTTAQRVALIEFVGDHTP